MISSWGSDTVARPPSAAARASRQARHARRVRLGDEGQLGVEVDDRPDVARPAIASSTPRTTSTWSDPVSIVSMPALACHG